MIKTNKIQYLSSPISEEFSEAPSTLVPLARSSQSDCDCSLSSDGCKKKKKKKEEKREKGMLTSVSERKMRIVRFVGNK